MTKTFDQICSQIIKEMVVPNPATQPNTGAAAAINNKSSQKPGENTDLITQLNAMMSNANFAKELQDLLKKHQPTPTQPAAQQPNAQPNSTAPAAQQNGAK